MSTISVRLGLDSFRTFIDPDLAKDMDFNDMIYAEGAGRHTSKRCLPGTQEDILTEIKTWIDGTGEDVEWVLWLLHLADRLTPTSHSYFARNFIMSRNLMVRTGSEAATASTLALLDVHRCMVRR